jgi:hypothetical protein
MHLTEFKTAGTRNVSSRARTLKRKLPKTKHRRGQLPNKPLSERYAELLKLRHMLETLSRTKPPRV